MAIRYVVEIETEGDYSCWEEGGGGRWCSEPDPDGPVKGS